MNSGRHLVVGSAVVLAAATSVGIHCSLIPFRREPLFLLGFLPFTVTPLALAAILA